LLERVAYLVTLCDRQIERTCPIFPGATWRLIWPLENAAAIPGQEERRAVTRRVRDEIRAHVVQFVQEHA
jgi:arsenate reductase (thioredoxin)